MLFKFTCNVSRQGDPAHDLSKLGRKPQVDDGKVWEFIDAQVDKHVEGRVKAGRRTTHLHLAPRCTSYRVGLFALPPPPPKPQVEGVCSQYKVDITNYVHDEGGSGTESWWRIWKKCYATKV